MYKLAKISFGKFIEEKRVTQKKSIRFMASELGISAAYLSDIEKGNRYPANINLPIFIDKLCLNEDEIDTFYDLIGIEKENFFDINTYLIKNCVARKAIRLAIKKQLTITDWQIIIDEYIKKI